MNVMHFYFTQASRVHEGFAGPTQRGTVVSLRFITHTRHAADVGQYATNATRGAVGASLVTSSSWHLDLKAHNDGDPTRIGCTRAPIGVVPLPHMEQWLP